ncbi:MAG TPA: hypothetical protein VIW94_10740 [Acidimicrobiia bacterium]
MRFTTTVTYDSPATDEKDNSYTHDIDLDAAAYAVRHFTLVKNDKRTKALESIATILKDRLPVSR